MTRTATRSVLRRRRPIAARIGQAVIVIAALVGVVWGGGLVSRVRAADDVVAAAEQVIAGEGDEATLIRAEAECGPLCPAEARVTAAAARNSLALRSQATLRLAYLGRVERDLQGLVEGPEARADALVQLAQARAVRADAVEPALEPLARSYQRAPFSTGFGVWRLRVVGSNWAAASPALRIRALDEAEWLIRIRPDDRAGVEALFSDPAAAMAFRLRSLRSGARVTQPTVGSRAPLPL